MTRLCRQLAVKLLGCTYLQIERASIGERAEGGERAAVVERAVEAERAELM
jgi:hypothetical protein